MASKQPYHVTDGARGPTVRRARTREELYAEGGRWAVRSKRRATFKEGSVILGTFVPNVPGLKKR